PRPPVVTIMGHVDHGKTSLLDVIRQTNVTAGEAGGITQHIGAYQVRYKDNKITFLDTPGHEAFTAMRLRGAKSTDIAVLVVAADDGVMPQTIEAINHAKSADVPIIVAINKMDKPGANPDHVKQQLSEHGLLPEEWGGDVIMVPVSAKQKQGIDDLLENILLVAEVMELKANPNRKAYGVVIEAQLDKGRGAVCTVLVQKGSLRVGDTVLAGTAYGKVRAMTNERGEKVKVARPSMPVEILGFSEVPQAGEIINGMDDNEARAIAEKRIAKQRVQELQATHKVTLDDIFNQIQQGELKDLNIIIKADVQGSVEALRQSLEGIKNPEVRIVIVHAAVGAINESDIMLASASNAIVMGFNVRPDANVRRAAEQEKVDLRTYRVIYDAINDVESAMRGMLAPQFKEVVVGRAEVRQVISTPKAIVAGSYVTEGRITNDSEVRLIRDGIVVFEGKVDSLRRFKDEVKEVKTSFECGISLEGYRDIKEGDVIEAYLMEEIAPQL
ncbi:MAG: translation initiation factor IF-2, partial [Veillonella sp.]|nr:translation initiation factor IF-2 [Veillonella sp.]